MKKFDVVVAACDVPGIQKLLPEDFRKVKEFDNIYKLDAVPVATVQLRFNGWVTELQDKEKMRVVSSSGSSCCGCLTDVSSMFFNPGLYTCMATH